MNRLFSKISILGLSAGLLFSTGCTKDEETPNPCETLPTITNILPVPTSSSAKASDGSLIIHSDKLLKASYSLNGEAFLTNNTFRGLSTGTYKVRVKDENGCISEEKEVTIEATPSLFKYSTHIKPILAANCNACHGEEANTNLSTYEHIKANAEKIKTQVVNETMPIGGKTLSDIEIKAISSWVDAGALND